MYINDPYSNASLTDGEVPLVLAEIFALQRTPESDLQLCHSVPLLLERSACVFALILSIDPR